MNPLTLAYRELSMGGHLLALGTASIAAAAAALLGHDATLALLLMAYLFSFGAYMMNRSAEMKQDMVSNPERTGYLSKRRRALPFVVGFAFLLGYGMAATVNLVFFAALLVPLALALAYSVGSRRATKIMGGRLKDRLFVKNATISLGWSLIPVLVGLYFLDFSTALLLLAPFIFLRLMVNTILFDIRDTEGDKANGVRTIPTELGVGRSYRLMSVFDLLSAAYVISLVALHAFPVYASVLVLLSLYSTVYRYAAVRGAARLGFLCDFVADGEYLIWGPLMYIGQVLI